MQNENKMHEVNKMKCRGCNHKVGGCRIKKKKRNWALKGLEGRVGYKVEALQIVGSDLKAGKSEGTHS